MPKKLFLMCFLLLAAGTFAQTDYVTVQPYSDKSSYTPSEEIKAVLKLNIKEHFHINSYKVDDPTLIKTTVASTSNDFSIVHFYFPEDKLLKFEFSENKVRVYEGEVLIGLTLKPSEGTKEGAYSVPITLSYQACDDKVCYPPKAVTADLKLTIGTSGNAQNENIFSAVNFSVPTKLDETIEKSSLSENERTSAPPAEENQVSDFIAEKGLAVGLILIFLGGLALNLTPCVYPLIPITISYFGAQGTGGKKQSIMMGVFYAIGMSITYSSLGLFAALTGSLLGNALQNPIVIVLVALVLLTLATSMFGAFEIRVPQKLALAGNKNRSGFMGSLMMGLLVGFIAAPCIGPFVLSLLVYVGQVGNPFMGFLLFFVLSLGLGAPYIVLAAFSSSLNKLPRSGEWMEGVKVIFGLVLIGMALNTLSPVIPKDIYNIAFPLYIILAGVYLLMFTSKGNSSLFFSRFKAFAALTAVIAGTWMLKPEGAHEELKWSLMTELPAVEQSVNTSNKPTMIDFYADWCAQCKELDAYTYTDKEIIDLSKSLNNIKIDLTRENTAITDKYGIKGLPVVIFLNSKGEELRELRVTGFLKPEEFKLKINSLLDSEKGLTVK